MIAVRGALRLCLAHSAARETANETKTKRVYSRSVLKEPNDAE
jgi:hypothetical protein